MLLSNRIRECIDYLNQAHADLAVTARTNRYRYTIQNQISDKVFELDALLSEVDTLETAALVATTEALIARTEQLLPQPPAGSKVP